MKVMKLMLFVIIAISLNLSIQAQDKTKKSESALKSTSFKVSGNCESCKNRIESALKTDGISRADWNKDTKMLTVSYDPQKISLDTIHKKIAGVGHDTDKIKADDKIYAALPECCHYRETGK